MNIFKAVWGSLFFLAVLTGSCYGDTVILKNGKRVKGLVLERFKDRVVVSTFEGERTIKKSAIRSVIYDTDEKALLQDARNLFVRGNYVDSFYAYEKVLSIDPAHSEARLRYDYLKGFLEGSVREDIRKDVELKQEAVTGGSGGDPLMKVRDDLGVSIGTAGQKTVVTEVVDDSPAARSGLKEGDTIVAVWGELTDYRSVEEVAEMMSSPGEVRLLIARVYEPLLSGSVSIFDGILFSRYGRTIGGALSLEKEGVVVSGVRKNGPFSRAGIRKGDRLTEIDGVDITYMPMSSLISRLRRSRGERLPITVFRDITIWSREK
ncbi:MAG: PDZ domain-containing protein [Candidatus Omnitrophica bacterium]|nr:PDZ domain-containing protein [Candidatus Omnitrophota bacterium]